jgi:hypothetical protein
MDMGGQDGILRGRVAENTDSKVPPQKLQKRRKIAALLRSVKTPVTQEE